MRHIALLAAAAFVIAATGNTVAAPASPAGLSQGSGAPIVPAQAQEKKSEPIKQKIKRIWRNWTGYKFDVACPALIPLSHSTCTETGKNREEARAKCQSRNPLCAVNSISR